MAGETGLHNLVFALVAAKNVARGQDGRGQRTRGHGESTIGQILVAKAAALAAGIARNVFAARVLDEGVVALVDLEVVGRPNGQLHGGAGLHTALLTMAPTRKGRIASHFGLKGLAHAAPGTSGHLAVQREGSFNRGGIERYG
eukprot:CAMPEP_0168783674 /NCGR_PEP_ID=MMETSP0725-20121227/9818_1 /TAXON_ID=265536 /ORGANISM="Amphiprora sp., Strain CCMP467" /LENGTH=142 /DNA_ID=CAMNT_0008833679 /DNA_START=226 /DNA_END=650 /DNA_ORIENTATION=+